MNKEKQPEKLRVTKLVKTIFDMLNYANMYVLVLDDKMEIKYVNQSLAVDLGFKNYKKAIGRCWLDFVNPSDKKLIVTVHKIICSGAKEAGKYEEFQNSIFSLDGKKYDVTWFNSYTNGDIKWSFSFGIRKKPITEITTDSIRSYYQDVIHKDKTMIEAMRDMIIFKEKVIDSCEPHFDTEEK